MRILIEVPTWLGDAVMITPSLENLLKAYDKPSISFIGTSSSLELFNKFPCLEKIHYTSKSYIKLIKIYRSIGKYDLFISYRSSLRTLLLRKFINSQKKIQFSKNLFRVGHQVERYNSFVNHYLKTSFKPGRLKLYSGESKVIFHGNKPVLGINPGATYGSAKKWTEAGFSEVIQNLSNKFDIVIFGSKQEEDICNAIENAICSSHVTNYKNLCGKTSIQDLMAIIKGLSLFITGDSGPMHIAGAFQIPTVAIFGPTKYKETSQWNNKNSTIIRKELSCQPCMSRKCPLGHHNCMKLISSEEVIRGSLELIRKMKVD